MRVDVARTRIADRLTEIVVTKINLCIAGERDLDRLLAYVFTEQCRYRAMAGASA
jgi:hypothetical protein